MRPRWIPAPTADRPDRMVLDRTIADRVTGGRATAPPERLPWLMRQVDRGGSNLLQSFS